MTVERAAARAAPAALLRRVDREPRAAHLHAARARLPRLPGRASRWRKEHRERGAARPAHEEGGQRASWRCSAAAQIHPINVRVGGFYRAPHARRAARAAARAALGARCRAETVALGGGFAFPESSATTSSSRCATPTSTRSARAASSRPRAGHRRRASTTSTSSRSRCRTPTRCTPRMRGARRLPVRPAGPLQPELRPAARRWRRRRPARAGLRRPCRNPFKSILVRARGDGPRLRRGAAHHRGVRAARPRRPSTRRRAPARATAAPRRRAGCSTTATTLDAEGTILDARIVPPTSQNQKTIEDDLRALAPPARRAARTRTPRAARAGDPQLRPVHLLRDALPHAEGGAGMSGRARVIGLGQAAAGDDQVGLAVIEHLRSLWCRRAPGAAPGPGAERAPAAAGDAGPVSCSWTRCSRFRRARCSCWSRDELEQRGLSTMSTHGLGVAQAVALARLLSPSAVSPSIRIIGVSISRPERFRRGLCPRWPPPFRVPPSRCFVPPPLPTRSVSMHEFTLARQVLETASSAPSPRGRRVCTWCPGWVAETEALSAESLSFLLHRPRPGHARGRRPAPAGAHPRGGALPRL